MIVYSPIDEDNDGIVGINDLIHFYINNILVERLDGTNIIENILHFY
jgi:hypothetical protein